VPKTHPWGGNGLPAIARAARRLATCASLIALTGSHAARGYEVRLLHPAPELVASYRAYFGPSPHYRQSVDLGRPPAAQDGVFVVSFPSSLQGSAPLHLALTAVGFSGLESALSNEIVLPPSGPDEDGDGIPDDGDGSGVAGDARCRASRIDACDDDCPRLPNGPQLGSCVGGAGRGGTCDGDGDCGSGGWCSRRQEDADGDAVGDACDLCPLVRDPLQSDRDGDELGDACDARDDRAPPPSTAPRSADRPQPRPPLARPPSDPPATPTRPAPVRRRDPRDPDPAVRPTVPRDREPVVRERVTR